MSATDATLLHLGAFGELVPVGRPGGQGRVYRPQALPTELESEPLVVKLYRRPPDASAAAVLCAMVRWERRLDPGDRARLQALSAWPLAVLGDRGRVVGIAMRDASEEFAVPFRMPSGRTEPVLLALEHLLGADEFLRNRGLGIDLDTSMRVLVAERISGALAFLHRHGIAVGDLAPSNLLVAFTPRGPRARFIDCDSMVFRGARALTSVETGDWELPGELAEPSGTRAADAYKLGLVVLRLLARSHDARTVAPHLRRLPVELRELLHRALSADAANRPPAGEWQRTLAAMWRSGVEAPAPRRPPAPHRPPVAPAPHRPPVAPAARRHSVVPVARVVGGPRAALKSTSPSLRRAVAVLWIVALLLGATALISHLGERGRRPTTTIFYPPGPGGRIIPSVVSGPGGGPVQP